MKSQYTYMTVNVKAPKAPDTFSNPPFFDKGLDEEGVKFIKTGKVKILTSIDDGSGTMENYEVIQKNITIPISGTVALGTNSTNYLAYLVITTNSPLSTGVRPAEISLDGGTTWPLATGISGQTPLILIFNEFDQYPTSVKKHSADILFRANQDIPYSVEITVMYAERSN